MTYSLDMTHPTELTPNFSCGPVIDLRSIKAVPEYQVILSPKKT